MSRRPSLIPGRAGHYDAGNLTAACGTSLIGRRVTQRVTCRRCRASKEFKGRLWREPLQRAVDPTPAEDAEFWRKLADGLASIVSRLGAVQPGYTPVPGTLVIASELARSLLLMVETRIAREAPMKREGVLPPCRHPRPPHASYADGVSRCLDCGAEM